MSMLILASTGRACPAGDLIRVTVNAVGYLTGYLAGSVVRAVHATLPRIAVLWSRLGGLSGRVGDLMREG